MAPRTVFGRIFCIFYAVIGIPLLMAILTSFNRLTYGVAKRYNKKWDTLLSVSCTSPYCRKAIIISSCLGMIFLLLIVLPSFIIIKFENWKMITGIYYTFMSITTVGFGDFVAGNGVDLSLAARAAYKLCLMVYLIYGLALLTFTFNLFTAGNDTRRCANKGLSSSQKRFKATKDTSLSELQLCSNTSPESENHVTEMNIDAPRYVECGIQTDPS